MAKRKLDSIKRFNIIENRSIKANVDHPERNLAKLALIKYGKKKMAQTGNKK